MKKLTPKDVSRHTTAATDNTRMPFGKHAGTPLADVPASYLLWFYEQDWAEERYPDIYNYCKECEEQLYSDYSTDYDEAWSGDWEHWKD